MFNRQLIAALYGLPVQLHRMAQRLANATASWLLRRLFSFRVYYQYSRSGFILPTTVLLLMVVSLAVGAITLRTFERTTQVVGGREQQVIYNAATPAVDRARSKLEFLFGTDPRMPSGVPGEGIIAELLGNGANVITGVTDAYTIPGETRLDIDGDGNDDAAWSYPLDSDEDGTNDALVAYSIVFNTPKSGETHQMSDSSDTGIAARADRLQVRNSPLSGSLQLEGSCQFLDDPSLGAPIEQGWFPDAVSTSVLRKNFQVSVFVLPDDPAESVSTLEFQQDRQLNKGNKWGAWFRNDLELHPGPAFNWNGAMHTEGNFLVGLNSFTGYLISSPESCLYTRDASEITIADVTPEPSQGIPAFQGQVISGWTSGNNFSGSSRFHLHNTPPTTTGNNNVLLDKDRDSVVNSGVTPDDIILDPLVLATQDVSQSRKNGAGDPSVYRDADWKIDTKNFIKAGRIYNQSEDTPYLDDFFRADNRYGPKPRYVGKQIPGTIGEEITGNQLSAAGITDNQLTKENPPVDVPTDVGLDGYWERRARSEGLRLIVGERLELGNAGGWGGLNDAGEPTGKDDPLEPWESCSPGGLGVNNNRCHEARQRRMLRDNLAAVQATAVYHANVDTNGDATVDSDDWDIPAACLATTVHPGTWRTVAEGATFRDLTQGLEGFWDNTPVDNNAAAGTLALKPFVSDFFSGKGTNGWEYNVHPTAEFTSGGPIIQALQNLAYFAGDPNGGAPSFTPVQDNTVHPYPQMSMWGDFSVLRRIFEEEWNNANPASSYNALSPADKATLRSAACSLGMLAYNVGYLTSLDYSKDDATTPLLPQLAAALTNASASISPDATPEGFLAQLKADGVADNLQSLAQLIMLKEQIERDRIYGFQANTVDNFEDPDLNGGRYWNDDRWTNASGNDIAITADPINPTDRALRIRDDDSRVSRSVDLSGMTTPTLSFEYARENVPNNTNRYVAIELSTNGTTFTEVGRITGNGIDDPIHQVFIYPIPTALVSESTTLRFVSSSNLGGSENVYINHLKFSNASGDYATANCETWTDGLEKLCTSYPKFPTLHALFPDVQHTETNNRTRLVNGSPDTNGNNVPDYIDTVNVNAGGGIQYTAFNIADPTILDDFIDDIALEPRPLDQWILPKNVDAATQNTTNPRPTHRTRVRIACVGPVACNTGITTNQSKFVNVAFKDTALFNGREMMTARVLNLNLALMRANQNGLQNSDYWLPNSGVVYGFREDAVREDEVVRPRRTAWGDCDQNATYVSTSGPNNATCRVNATISAENSTDPPLANTNLISPKVVDYYPDPDRRPFGFRLRNGEKIHRSLTNPNGLSMVSDNPIYIQGSLNLHQTTTCNGANSCRLEEFKEKLVTSNYNNFYTRKNLEPKFARPAEDLWRPTEILADAVTIISDDFCDGSIEDGIITAGEGSNSTLTSGDGEYSTGSVYNCNGNNNRTSFLDQNRPNRNPNAETTSINSTATRWHRENPYDLSSPIAVSRNGNLLEVDMDEYGDNNNERYFVFSDGKPLINAAIERVNAIIISGVVASRTQQGYGGLHNFPRFISYWDTLHISGAFLQLNFSNYATAPFDQDAWEVNQNSNGNQQIKYYRPPKRRWGYDVGLQYAPAGPVASRFVSAASVRSEFYSEPPADDPYMNNLCDAMVTAAGGTPNTECAS